MGFEEYIPWDKSWIIRMGMLDLINGRAHDTLDWLDVHRTELSHDLVDLGAALMVWESGPLRRGNNAVWPLYIESGTLYRFLHYTAWKQNRPIHLEPMGTLVGRPITLDPTIVGLPQQNLLLLDYGTSQWASAAVLNGDPERLVDPPHKLAVTYGAVDHWNSARASNDMWVPSRDLTLFNHAVFYLAWRDGRPFPFVCHQAEDWCLAYIFGWSSLTEGKEKYPSLAGHESNRLEEMNIAIDQINAKVPVTSADHRVVQACAMWSGASGTQVSFTNPDCVSKSWPQFWNFIEAYK